MAFIANEAIEDYKDHNREGVIFKIGFEKVYDPMDWDFMDGVVEKKGFGCR